MYNRIDITRQIEHLEELQQHEEQAYLNHDDLEQIQIYNCIVRLKKSILTNIVSSYGSGTIAGIIGNTKYSQIDKAVNKTLMFLFHAEEEQLYKLPVNGKGISDLILECYKAEEVLKDGIIVPDLKQRMEE